MYLLCFVVLKSEVKTLSIATRHFKNADKGKKNENKNKKKNKTNSIHH